MVAYYTSRLTFLLASLAAVASALDIKGTLVANDVLGLGELDFKTLGPAKVILDDGLYSSAVTRHGRFNIPHVPAGTYILQVLASQHQFEQLRIDVLPDSDLPEVRPYLPGTPLNPPSTVTLPYPLTLQPRQRLEFFAPMESFNVIGMFKNPMMLLMGATVLMVLGIPYIMKNLDPATMKEITEQQHKLAKAQSSVDFSSGVSGLLSNALSGGDDSKSPKGKGKGKKR